MPPRTNAFQKLILQLHECFGPDTVLEIRESQEFLDRAALVPREVDIVLYKRDLGRDAHVAIECTDRKTPADVPYIDEMIGKHSDIPTAQLILVCSSGFSEGACNKARAKNIGLIVPTPDEEWGAAALRLARKRYLACVTMVVERCTLTVLAGESIKPVRTEPDYGLYDAEGRELGALWSQVMPLLSGEELGRELLFGARTHPEAGWFQVGSRPPEPSPTLVWTSPPMRHAPGETLLTSRLGSGLFLRNGDGGGALERVLDFAIDGQFKSTQGPAKVKMGQIEGRRVIWGEVTFDGKTAMVTGIDGDFRLHAQPAPKKKTKTKPKPKKKPKPKTKTKRPRKR